MGRKSYESIGRPLPKRTNVVITRNPFFVASNCIVVHSVEEGLKFAMDNAEDEAFIIGGGEIYRLSMPFLDRIYLTDVDLKVEGTVSFPELDPKEWKVISTEKHEPDEKNEHAFTFKILERVRNG